MLDDAQLALVQKTTRGVLATLKRDGTPQMSVIDYHYDPERELLRISVTDSRAKTRNLRRDPRASVLVTPPDAWGYVVLEGKAEVTPAAATPDDATVDELVDVYRAIAGEHPDWAEYRQAMVDDRRLVIRIRVEHTYGWASAG